MEDDGGATAGCKGADCVAYASGDGSFWRPVGARPPAKEILVARDGRHGGGSGEGVLVMRTCQSRIKEVGKGAPALTDQRAWVLVRIGNQIVVRFA